jgi:hypothetical protein
MQVKSGARRGSQGGTGIPNRSVAREDMPGKSLTEHSDTRRETLTWHEILA